MEKYLEHLENAIKSIKVADHIIYITYPIVKDKRLLLSSINKIYESLLSVINAILQYDYLWKRIKLYESAKDNFQVFIEKSGPRYGITSQEILKILEFMSLVETHKKSPIEFLRHEKIVIMMDNLSTKTIDIELIKSYLNLVKSIIGRARFLLK